MSRIAPSLPNCALCRWISLNFIYILNQFAFHLAALRLTAAPHAQLICSTLHGMSQYITIFQSHVTRLECFSTNLRNLFPRFPSLSPLTIAYKSLLWSFIIRPNEFVSPSVQIASFRFIFPAKQLKSPVNCL